jgi:hypothetical protein
MSTAWVIEVGEVLKYGRLCRASGVEWPAPGQLSLDRFEECLDGADVIAITPAAHQRLQAVFAQDGLVVVLKILTAFVAVEDEDLGRRHEGDAHLQRSDRQIPLHAIAHSPACRNAIPILFGGVPFQ